MIVVIGSTWLRGAGPEAVADGLTGMIVRSAATADTAVELITKVGDDPVGDALLLSLARDRVGHVAVLRDAVHRTAQRPATDPVSVVETDPNGDWIVTPSSGSGLDSADVGLALRYLTDYRVIVAVHPGPGVVGEAAAAADWAGAHLIVITRPDEPVPDGVPSAALVVAVADGGDEVEAVGERLGRYAAAVDRGEDAAAAFAALTAEPG